MRRTALILAAALACFAATCTSSAKKDANAAAPAAPRKKEPEKPWTTAFAKNTVIVADEVSIEGPPGLLEHVVVSQGAEFFEHSERATPDGMLQITRVKDDAVAPPAIRVQLDAWAIEVVRSVRVLERVTEVPVTLDARGSVFAQALADSSEKRSESMHFVGTRP